MFEYLELPERLTVYIAANTAAERQNWVEHFTHVLGAATCITCVGTWEGIVEPVVKVEHFCVNANKAFCDIVFSLVNYKNICTQEAVSVQFNSTLVVFSTVKSLFNYADKVRPE